LIKNGSVISAGQKQKKIRREKTALVKNVAEDDTKTGSSVNAESGLSRIMDGRCTAQKSADISIREMAVSSANTMKVAEEQE
jgi:hypothetical protein